MVLFACPSLFFAGTVQMMVALVRSRVAHRLAREKGKLKKCFHLDRLVSLLPDIRKCLTVYDAERYLINASAMLP